ncbi:MAG TPA: PVC-type heme-binding CxxCH protein, partial [Planctomycetaceae bacterium]|nr:PVC-type heme-binding CxxCH protein [Planctomycetaceae bacterium]
GKRGCLDARSGKIVWQRNILREFGAKNLKFGISESVLVDEDRLICTPGGDEATLAALDLQTGKVIWKTLLTQKDRAAYASPVVAEVGGLRQYVQFTASGTVGVRADNGNFLWRDNTAANSQANCSSPLVVGNLVFTSSSYGTGGALVNLVAEHSKIKAVLSYHTADMKSHHGDMVVVDDLLYGSSDPHNLTCLELATGKVKWRTRYAGKGSITYADGRLYYRSEQGLMTLVEATGAEYREVGRFDQPQRSDRPAWSHPVVAAGRLFLRDQDLLLCYDLRGPTPPEQAAASISVPPGFHVSLFASEPVVKQPIALATDARGRLWVAENNTYNGSMGGFELSQHDRIVILEDTDGDGRADRHTVFCNTLQKLTSVEIGFGGVWALCPPQLLFIPDRNGDDRPDGLPEVVLDGWAEGPQQHHDANGLRWGPDGWLYGRQGIFRSSYVGAPGSLPSQRTLVKGGIWRYHPTRKIFEVVCQGTTNPWGMDWNEQGELFFVNTIIGHLWHAVPGAHFQQAFAQDELHQDELIGQTADHYHWSTSPVSDQLTRTKLTSPSVGGAGREERSQPVVDSQSSRNVSQDHFGGGHAHAGLMIYQGDNWPDRYRGSLFMVNLLGHRLNNDTLERRGCGYVGRHAPDFCQSSDPWFQGIEVLGAPDGGAFIADWCDRGECHGDDGVDLSSGRIYEVSYGGSARGVPGDLARLTDAALVALQLHKNEWFVRQSRRILQERAVAGRLSGQTAADLKAIFETDPSTGHQLRALWCLHVTGAAPESWLLAQLGHKNEHVRAWAVRLLSDGKTPSADATRSLVSMASQEPSGLVLLYLASALSRVAPIERWAMAERLAAHAEFASDSVFPLIVWYGIEPAVVDNPSAAVKLADSSRLPPVARFVARRLTENVKRSPQPVNQLVELVAKSSSAPKRAEILRGMAEALRGWHRAPMPQSWTSMQAALSDCHDDKIRRLVRELSVVFGDGRSLEEVLQVAGDDALDLAVRRDALRILVAARHAKVVPLLRQLLNHASLGDDAARGLAAFNDPQIAGFLVQFIRGKKRPAQQAAIVALCSRPRWAQLLLVAVSAGQIDRTLVPAFQIQQMAMFRDAEVRKRVTELWPETKTISAGKRQRIDDLKTHLDAASLQAANLPNGRRRFVQTCATCHVLFGQGARFGPDLTGSQRMNLDFLLQNIVDPSATVVPGYRMSTIYLVDGRVVHAILNDHGGPTLTVQTPTECLFVNRGDIEQIRKSDVSLMPERLLDVLSETEVRDLIAYLMSPQQVPLPNDGHQ